MEPSSYIKTAAGLFLIPTYPRNPSNSGLTATLSAGNREFRDGYHRATHRIMKGEQGRRGLGSTDGLAFVPHTVAV
jgi:hypothetical protein